MIVGEFKSQGELVFEIGLVAADNSPITVKALLDTGFSGYLAVNSQDAESLEWSLRKNRSKFMQTAWGNAKFNVYEGKVLLGEEQFTIEVIAGLQLEDTLLGVQWLQTKRLVADFPAGVLTLG